MNRTWIAIIAILLIGCTPTTGITLSPGAEAVPVEAAVSAKLSADGRTFVKSITRGDDTQVTVKGPLANDGENVFRYDGQWGVTAVAPNGTAFVLTRQTPPELEATWRLTDQWQTNIQLFDTATGDALHEMQLEGNFEVEAIDNNGKSVYLIEHIPAVNPEKYRVRLYDLTVEELAPDPLRDKRVTEEFMTGYAWGTAASPNGEWLMTLYLNSARNQAFIHALNLNNRFTLCLDLPSGDGDFDKLQHYTLALAPDNQTVYAANAALGRLVGINLEDLSRTHSALFEPVALDAADAMHASAITVDGRHLYFSATDKVWHYDTNKSEVSGPRQLGGPVEWMEVDRSANVVRAAIDNEPIEILRPTDFVSNKFLKALED